MQIIITFAGSGQRFKNKGFDRHKALISFNEHSVIERLLSRFPLELDYHFILSNEASSHELATHLLTLRPSARLHMIEPHQLGPSYSVQKIQHHLDQEKPCLVTYCDYDMSFDYADFAETMKRTNAEASLVSYTGFHPHYLSNQTYAYSRLENGKVVEIKEKGSFTSNRENEWASCGAYYFASGELLKRGIEEQFKQNLKKENEFYLSLAIEALLQTKKITFASIYPIDTFIHLGTPEDVEHFKNWEDYFLHHSTKPTVGSLELDEKIKAYWSRYFNQK